MRTQEPGNGVGGTRRLRILFIPQVELLHTSERTPMFFRTMRERHDVIGLPAPRDRIVYSPRFARFPRFLLYLLDKVVLGLQGLLLARRHGADVVFCETAHHALAGLAVARVLGIRCVWDSHGNGKLFYEGLGKDRLSVRLVTVLERFLGKRVDDLITVSEVDAAAYEEMGLPLQKIHVIPVCVDMAAVDSTGAVVPTGSPNPHPDDAPPTLLFFGSFQYEPNREALEFVNTRLAPHLEEHGVRSEIRIAGRDIPDRGMHPLVHPVGFVPDIHSCIRTANLCVVPVRKGVGVLTKVIDVMAVGTPLVLFEFAVRGIPDIRHGVHAFVASTEREFLQYVTDALAHPEACRAMSRRARQLVEEKYDWDSYIPELDAILRGTRAPSGGEVGH